jgi:hypothetical protein
MKVLFLDIDGVLNSRRTAVAFDGYPHSFSLDDMRRFDHVAIGLIRRLCDETGCSVALSSSWRYDYTAQEVAAALSLPVIDATPLSNGTRQMEIKAWLLAHPDVTSYAIVDDVGPMLKSQKSRFVQTDELHGLTLTDYLNLKRILGVSA